MKRWVAWVVLLLLFAPILSDAYTGAGGMWGFKTNDFVAKPFSGDTAGRDAAYSYMGNEGVVMWYPGLGAVPFGTIPYGVTVIRSWYGGYDIAGRMLRWFDRNGVEFFRVDSLGVNIKGVAKSDSANYPGGVFLGNVRINKVNQGQFTHDFGSVTNGTTLDETQAVSETGLDITSNWSVTVTPQFDLPAGVTVTGRVSADNVVKLRASNTCATTQDPPSGTYKYLAVK